LGQSPFLRKQNINEASSIKGSVYEQGIASEAAQPRKDETTTSFRGMKDNGT